MYLRHGKKLCGGFDIRPGGHRPPWVPRLSLRAAMVTVAHGGQDGQPLRVTGGWFVLAVLRVCSRPGEAIIGYQARWSSFGVRGNAEVDGGPRKGVLQVPPSGRSPVLRHARQARLLLELDGGLPQSSGHSMAGSRHRLDRDVASASVRGACDLRRGSLNGHPGFRTPTCARPFLSNNDAMPSYTEEP